MPSSESADDGRTWQELLVTVLLVVAALGTSWSSYQATRWNGEQAAAAGRTNAIRIDAARAQGLSEAETQVDVATFIVRLTIDMERLTDGTFAAPQTSPLCGGPIQMIVVNRAGGRWIASPGLSVRPAGMSEWG